MVLQTRASTILRPFGSTRVGRSNHLFTVFGCRLRMRSNSQGRFFRLSEFGSDTLHYARHREERLLFEKKP
ncbi:hypothetical protein CHELA20_53211 [Hyphomicrobiales bacterium]|nr:hypothetical protein CHELA41_21712 [Hyphomicrobiales bacterium]CAH1683796.1 hypothetical protein CHELA20_53211 [Hyphomicrobiales bacterium]